MPLRFLQLGAVAVQLDEERELGEQRGRAEGFDDEIDGAERVSLALRHFVRVSRDEQDGGLARTFLRADEARRLDAVHARHVQVEQHRREILVTQQAHGFGA